MLPTLRSFVVSCAQMHVSFLPAVACPQQGGLQGALPSTPCTCAWLVWCGSCAMHVCVLGLSGRVRLFATPWTLASQAPLSMGFSRQEY